MSLVLQPHTVVLVCYDVPGATEWHERYVCALIDGSDYLIATPTFDFYVETLSTANADLSGMRFYRPGGGLPLGVVAREVFGFGAMSQSDRSDMCGDGWDLAVMERASRQLPPLVGRPPAAPNPGSVTPATVSPSPGAQPSSATPPVAASRRGITSRVASTEIWVIDEPCGAGEVGDPVQLPAGTQIVGDRALIQSSGEVYVVRRIAVGTDVASYVQERKALLADDHRIAPVTVPLSEGRFSEVVGDLVHVPTLGFDKILEGPPTVAWQSEKIANSSEAGYVPRHNKWVVESHIPHGSKFTHEHLVISKTLDSGVKWDRLNIKNLVSFEYLSRRLQLIEEVHSEDPQNPNWEGAEFFMGDVVKKGAMVAPELKKHVASELGHQAQIMKEKRKAREARKGLGGPK